MKKKLVSALLVAAMAAGVLAGCGNNGSSSANNDASSEEGKVINIYCWNTEFIERLNEVYSEVDKVSDDGTVTYLKDGTEIHWINNPNQDGVYQQKLDEALLNQASADDDDKVDMFLAEMDGISKYTDAESDMAMPLTELGIDPDKDMADQYAYTKTAASDSEGVQRASTWQCCPGVLVYRRDIAKAVFGTDDPEAIGEKVKDWDTMEQSAEVLKENGYYILSTYVDTCRLYSNNIDEPWVESGSTTVRVDQKMIDWVNDSKAWKDAGYFDPSVSGQWNSDWYNAMGPSSKVFSFLLPAWGIDTQIKKNCPDEGLWGVTTPPQGYNWGGSFVLAARGTDNPEHVKDIILAMTVNKDNLKTISQKFLDFTNNEPLMDEAAAGDDANYNSSYLGGENPFTYYSPAAKNIKLAPLSIYDQGCVEEFQSAFDDYLKGTINFDKAKENFERQITERHPELTEVQWPE